MRLRSFSRIALFLIVILAVQPVSAVRAGEGITGVGVDFSFGSQISFYATLADPEAVSDVQLSFRARGENKTEVVSLVPGPSGELSYTHPASQLKFRTFSTVEYWFTVQQKDGQVYNTPVETFFYEDNRFKWQVLDDAPFHVHWYAGDRAFAQSVVDSARAGLNRAMSYLPFPSPERVDIYVYATAEEMRATLRFSGQNAAGHADPDLGVIVVSLPYGNPEQRSETDRQVPHELTHILLYNAVGTGYSHLPIWLNEGLASVMESTPNPDYQSYLENAVAKKALLPISSLCESFPVGAFDAYLAYAESASFTRYLFSQYGRDKMKDLVSNYALGLDCQQGVVKAFGSNLDEIDKNWRRQTLSQADPGASLSERVPWLVLMLISLIAPVSMALIRRRETYTTASTAPALKGE